jgi:quinol monooxygenase YgiN
MIRHAALFRLKHAAGSAAEADFLKALDGLRAIPGVGAFGIAREISPGNPFAFAVSMTFADQAAYDAYNTRSTRPSSRAAGSRRWNSSWNTIPSR